MDLIIEHILNAGNFFEVLSLRDKEECTCAEVRKQYRSLAIKVHPDKNKHAQATRAFQLLSEAFECLVVPETRHVYLQKLQTSSSKTTQQNQKQYRHHGKNNNSKTGKDLDPEFEYAGSEFKQFRVNWWQTTSMEDIEEFIKQQEIQSHLKAQRDARRHEEKRDQAKARKLQKQQKIRQQAKQNLAWLYDKYELNDEVTEREDEIAKSSLDQKKRNANGTPWWFPSKPVTIVETNLVATTAFPPSKSHIKRRRVETPSSESMPPHSQANVSSSRTETSGWTRDYEKNGNTDSQLVQSTSFSALSPALSSLGSFALSSSSSPLRASSWEHSDLVLEPQPHADHVNPHSPSVDKTVQILPPGTTVSTDIAIATKHQNEPAIIDSELVCSLCRRKFMDAAHKQRHLLRSSRHQENLKKQRL